MIGCISLIFISIGLFLFFVQKLSRNKKRDLIKKKDIASFSILIPARDESAVIEDLLDSIQKQSIKIPSKDIYVIIESREDPTYNIAKKRGISIVVRKGRIHRKGYALEEAVTQILKKGKHYDLYFIFDADNVLSETFIEEMFISYKQGFEIAAGCRCPKNARDSIVAAASSLIFLLLNSILNKDRMKKNRGVILSGTGFYLSGTLIEKLHGYPFHTLTEDYELSLYSTIHNIASTYNEKAIYYDEQPISLKQSMIQRTRWIKGFFEVRRKYVEKLRKALIKKDFPSGILNDLIGITPVIFLLIGVSFYLGYNLFCIITCLLFRSSLIFQFLFTFGMTLFLLYFLLQILTLFIMIYEKEHLNLSFGMYVRLLFYHPIFLSTYIHCAIKALFSKRLEWIKIEHYGNKHKQ